VATTLIVDTNVLLAAADTSAAEHSRCASLLDEREDIAITAPVAAETAWMLDARLGPDAESAFVTSVAVGELPVIELERDDWRRCAQLVARYADLRLGLVDASIVAVAEPLNVITLATLNAERDHAGDPQPSRLPGRPPQPLRRFHSAPIAGSHSRSLREFPYA
jgi:predicted nucleic acid-binding protein